MKSLQFLTPLSKLKAPLLLRTISGHSMVPTLPPGTLVVGNGMVHRFKPGQVVIFLHDGKEKIKRINIVRDNEMYVLGDHVDASTDSRHYGWVPLSTVRARIIWPRTSVSLSDDYSG